MEGRHGWRKGEREIEREKEREAGETEGEKSEGGMKTEGGRNGERVGHSRVIHYVLYL